MFARIKPRKIYLIAITLAVVLSLFFFYPKPQRAMVAGLLVCTGRKTVSNRVAEYGAVVHARLADDLARMGFAKCLPGKMTLIAFKQEKLLEVWLAGSGEDKYRLFKTYPILKGSGKLGPKLRAGDLQVPEGIYKLESLNPNSKYHLSLRLDYPNAFDRARGREDGREDLGSDIMIHGGECSIGCLAMGDEAAEDLFVLAAQIGIENIKVIICPVDFRKRELPDENSRPPNWVCDLYVSLRKELSRFFTED